MISSEDRVCSWSLVKSNTVASKILEISGVFASKRLRSAVPTVSGALLMSSSSLSSWGLPKWRVTRRTFDSKYSQNSELLHFHSYLGKCANMMCLTLSSGVVGQHVQDISVSVCYNTKYIHALTVWRRKTLFAWGSSTDDDRTMKRWSPCQYLVPRLHRIPSGD